MLSPRAAALFRLHLPVYSFHALRRQFFLHAMTNLPLFKRVFITKFVTHVRKLVIKTFLKSGKIVCAGRENFLGDRKIFPVTPRPPNVGLRQDCEPTLYLF